MLISQRSSKSGDETISSPAVSPERDNLTPRTLPVSATTRPSDGLGRALVQVLKVVQVVAHGDEKVEEHLAPLLHLHLHGAAALERSAAANNQSEVVSAQARVRVRRAVVREARAAEDRR